MQMPPARFVCDFHADAPPLHLAEYFAPSHPCKILGVVFDDCTCKGLSVALRRYDVLGLSYGWEPLLQKLATAAGDSPVAARTPLDHAMVHVCCGFITADASPVDLIMTTPGEVLHLGCRGEPPPGHWIDTVFSLKLCKNLVVPEGIVFNQFPLFSLASNLGQISLPDDRQSGLRKM